MPCMTCSTWSNLNHSPYLYHLWVACHWWSVEVQTRSCHACFNFVPGRQRCTRAVALMNPASCSLCRRSKTREIDLCEILIWTRSFQIYGIWLQASTYVNTLLQCSPASVGLTQAYPNYYLWVLITYFATKLYLLFSTCSGMCDMKTCSPLFLVWLSLPITIFIYDLLIVHTHWQHCISDHWHASLISLHTNACLVHVFVFLFYIYKIKEKTSKLTNQKCFLP